MSRNKESPKKSVKSNIQHPANTWLFTTKDDILKSDSQTETPNIVSLRHPRTNEGSLFLFSPVNNTVHEIQTFSTERRSWFINQCVKSDGRMHICTPIDPVFLVLSYLYKNCNTRAVPLEHLLVDDEFPEAKRLINLCNSDNLKVVGDQKGPDNLLAFRYNEEKTLWWLKKKTEVIVGVLKQKALHVGSEAVSKTFIKLNNDSPDDEYLKYAHGIISEYLHDNLSKRLFTHLGISEQSPVKNVSLKRSSIDVGDRESKKIKTENEPPKNNVIDFSKLAPKKTPPLSSKEKARNKVAAKSKSISSFFTKK